MPPELTELLKEHKALLSEVKETLRRLETEPDTIQAPKRGILTLRQLVEATGECERGLRTKLKAGKFKGAYRTGGGAGSWRIPAHAVRAYLKANSITIP